MLKMSLENYYNKLSDQINFYFSTVIIPIGILLNSLTILVFTFGEKSKINVNSNITLLNIGHCTYDTLALLNSILFSQMLPSIGINVMNYSLSNCLALNWWRRTIGQATSWLQVVLTFERFVSVVYVNRFTFFKSKFVVIGILFSTFTILGFVNIGQFWFYIEAKQSVNNTANMTANQVCTSSNSVALATDLINVFFRFLIPFIVMLTMNILLSRSLFRSKKRTNAKSQQLSNSASFKRERNYTITIIGFNCVFFVLNIPWAIWYVLSHIQQAGLALQSSLDRAAINLLNSIVFSIFYLNNSSSFILNICFNRWFRQQFLFLIRFQWRSSLNNRAIHTSTNAANLRLKTKVAPL